MPGRTTSTGRPGRHPRRTRGSREHAAAGAATPREAPASRTTLAAGRAARPLRFFFRYTNHMTGNSTETDEKPCPLTVSEWIALLAAESQAKSGHCLEYQPVNS